MVCYFNLKIQIAQECKFILTPFLRNEKTLIAIFLN
jgi:hypothetical protein